MPLMRLVLYAFRFRDPVTRKWVRARYVAERREIEVRYAEWEIIGPPELRDVDLSDSYFNPLGRAGCAPRFRYPMIEAC